MLDMLVNNGLPWRNVSTRSKAHERLLDEKQKFFNKGDLSGLKDLLRDLDQWAAHSYPLRSPLDYIFHFVAKLQVKGSAWL